MRISLIFSLVLCLLFAIPTDAKPLKKKQVPRTVKKAFRKQVPKTKAIWEKIKDGFDAQYKVNGINQEAAFDSTGHWLYTETAIDSQLVPAAIMTSLAQAEYSKYPIIKRGKVKTPNYDDLYRITYQKGTTIIDALLLANGNMLKKTQRTAGQ